MELLVMAGFVLYVVGWLWTVVIALQESPLWAVGTLFIPIIWLFYLFSRWKKTWPCFICSFAGAVLFLAAGGVQWLQQ
jgi:hypothetical protein